MMACCNDFAQLPINDFLMWRNNFVIVIADGKGMGIRFVDDTEEDEACLVTPCCPMCNKEIFNRNKYCSRDCFRLAMIKARTATAVND